MSNASGDMRRVLEACEAALDELVSAAAAAAEAATAAAAAEDLAAPSESPAAADELYLLDPSAAALPPREHRHCLTRPP